MTDSRRTVSAKAGECLERSCKGLRDGIRFARQEAGVERIEARFHGNGFEPHRHDTYAIGLTLKGVQTFSYRGSERFSMPGQVIVLHPDEVHDGGAGTDIGLLYRMVYVQPELIAEALGHPASGLPFVRTPVIDDPEFRRCLFEVFEDLENDVGTLELNSFLCELSRCLKRHSGRRAKASSAGSLDWKALTDCQEYLRENVRSAVTSSELEALAGLDRFTLARQFRKAFGTSPHRYQVMRRLDLVKVAIAEGETLADAAGNGGFADQSHMTRHFKRTYGMTPGHWQRLCSTGGLPS